MKIAVTADVHLSGDDSHPERFHALEDVFRQVHAADCGCLIIAGDLFDRGYGSCVGFDDLCSRTGNAGTQILVIPGNHDSELSSRMITADNVTIFTSPTLFRIAPGVPEILFIPFERNVAMGQRIAESIPEKASEDWILVGHGDFISGTGGTNRYEPGVYMPLTGIDIQLYKPSVTLLGHIHKPYDCHGLHYPGSPCGLDINETGRRRFLVLDTDTLIVDQRPVITDLLYFQESFLVIPSREETERLQREAEERIRSWNVSDEERAGVRLRVEARGFTSDRSRVLKTLRGVFGGYEFTDVAGPDLSRLLPGGDDRLESVAEAVLERIDRLELPLGADEPDRDSIIEYALSTIYGG